MARKFLYLVAFCITIYIAGRIVLHFWSDELTRYAFVPAGEFEPQPPQPANAYVDPALWIARPGMAGANPAGWRPQGAGTEQGQSRAAVFFVHPTSYLEKGHWNARLDDAEANRIARVLVQALASPFGNAGSVWVPRYRQAAFGAFLTDAPESAKAFDLAYGDVRTAFDRFLAEAPADAPIVLAGHSQGAFHLRRLVAERIAGTPLAVRIVAVYAIGWPISIEHDLPAMGLPACAQPAQTGCVISWLSYSEPAEPDMMIAAYGRRPGLDGKQLAGSAFVCSNPLTGGLGGEAPASANSGTLVPDEKLENGTLKPALAAARCRPDGILSIGEGPEMGPFVFPGNNYHVYDIPLFWANLRADAQRRVAAWKP